MRRSRSDVAERVRVAVRHAQAVLTTMNEVLEHQVPPLPATARARTTTSGVRESDAQVTAMVPALTRALRELEEGHRVEIAAVAAWRRREAAARAQDAVELAAQAQRQVDMLEAVAASYADEIAAIRALLSRLSEIATGTA